MLAYLWRRFLLLGWVGKALTIAVALYLLGWIVGSLGQHSLAHQLGGIALILFAILLAAFFIRVAWRLSRKPGQ